MCLRQAVGGTRKQMADEALRSQILAMRQQQRPPAGTGPWDGAAAGPYMSRSAGAPPGASAAAPRPGAAARALPVLTLSYFWAAC